MKLGQALSLRARQAQKLDDLRGRIRANVLVQEGESPAEDADDLIVEYEKLSDEHQELVGRISRTNHEAMDQDGFHPIELLNKRETLRRRRNVHRETATEASGGSDARFRYMRSELKQIRQVNVAEHRQKVVDLENEIQELDSKIQENNWRIDLLNPF